MGTLELLLTIGALKYLNRDMEEVAYGFINQFTLNTDHFIISYLIDKAGMIKNEQLVLTSVLLFLSSIQSYTEGYGLFRRRKWAEWCAVISTSSWIPFELYAIFVKNSSITILVLLFNIAIVYYMIRHRELFKKKHDIFLP